MRAPLSVIIPTLNTAGSLGPVVASLFEGLEAGLIRELIISDGGSSDGTATMARDLGAMLLSGPAGRGGQLRRAANAASGAWFLFLHADTVPSKGWTVHVLRHIAQDQDMAAAFRLKFRAHGALPRFVAGWANLRSRLFGLPYGDQGLLISAHLYREIGGFADIPLMEDVAIARCLKQRIYLLDTTVVTSAERYEKHGWLRQGAANLWRLLRYLGGTAPERLMRNYRP